MLTSGQHRLQALAGTELTIFFVIFLNCPKGERAVIDQTLARGPRDVASLAHGVDIPPLALAMARTLKYGGTRGSVQMTPQETVAWYEQHGPAIRYVLKHIERTVPGVTTASVLGAVARAYYRLRRGDLKRFVQVLVSGMPERKHDRPVILLRNWLLEHRDVQRNTHGRMRAYARTQAALAAYRDGETPVRLYEPDAELFPLPGEDAA